MHLLGYKERTRADEMMEYYLSSVSKVLIEQRLYVAIFVATTFTIVVAVGVRYVLNRAQQQQLQPPITLLDDSQLCVKDNDGTNIKTRQSRLLRNQFGILEDDLKLYEESVAANDEKNTPILNVVINDDNGSTTGIDIMSSEQVSSDQIGSKLKDEDIDDMNLTTTVDETTGMGLVTIANDIEKENRTTTKQTIQQHAATTVVSPPSSPETKKRRQQQQKSQYERIQEYRRQQLLLAAESRLGQQQQQQQHMNRNVPPLFHFWTWYDIQTSLFRQYTFVQNDKDIDNTTEDNATIVPYHPSSKRYDRIMIQLRITNDLDIPIAVHWIDHIGRHIPKGIIVSNGGTWHQTTYVDHPWVFTTTSTSDDDDDDNRERVLLHFIPHQIIPSTSDAPTIDDELVSSSTSGIHRFHIVPSSGDTSVYKCTIHDPILPYPASHYLTTPRKAAEYALQHCIRMRYDKWAILRRYICNIIDHPSDVQYRYIRIANATFSEMIWNTPARGVLLAFNFIEHSDTGYVCFHDNVIVDDDKKGDDDNDDDVNVQKQLSVETIQELQLLLHMIKVSEQKGNDERI